MAIFDSTGEGAVDGAGVMKEFILGVASDELVLSPKISFLVEADCDGLDFGLAFGLGFGEDFGAGFVFVLVGDGVGALEIFVASDSSAFAEEFDAHFVGLSVSFQVADSSGVLPNVFPFPGSFPVRESI